MPARSGRLRVRAHGRRLQTASQGRWGLSAHGSGLAIRDWRRGRQLPRCVAGLARRDHVARQREAEARAQARAAEAPRRDGAVRVRGGGSRRGRPRRRASSRWSCSSPGENVAAGAARGRVRPAAPGARDRRLSRRRPPARRSRRDARALARGRSRKRRHADPDGRRVRRRGGALATGAPIRSARRRCAPRPGRSSACRCSPWDDAPGRRIALVAHGGEPLSELDLEPRRSPSCSARSAPGCPASSLAGCEHGTIPLPGAAESLNVAAAGAIALYECRADRADLCERSPCPSWPELLRGPT